MEMQAALFFLEDGGSRFHRNFGKYLIDTRRQIPGDS
jgi:hypothetical protein